MSYRYSDYNQDPRLPPRRQRSSSPPTCEDPPESPPPPKPETMASWLQRQASSRQTQIAATAVISGAVVAGAILGFQAIRRREAVEELKASIPELNENHHAEQLTEYGGYSPPSHSSREDERGAVLAQRARRGEYNEELILEQLARNRVFLTPEGLRKLRNAFIIVVGLGGVGSHCAAALARSGVSRIRLVDFDQVTLSSLNRHSVATLADVGTPKVTCLKRRIEQITPWVHFDCRNELFKPSSAEKLLGPWNMPGSEDLDPKPTYIVDAIDNISSKVSLLNYCHSHSLPVISSMGSATKSDPTKLVIADISHSTDDPLSKSTRRRLKALGISSGIPVIFSTEKPAPGKAELQPLPDAPDPGDLAPLKDFRVRILPVLGTMPAVFGYSSANYVICEVAGYPMDYNPAPTDRHKLYDQILATLQGLEERLTRTEAHQDAKGIRIPVTVADVAFLVEEVYRGKSVISGLGSRLALIRWEKPERGFGADQKLSLSGQKAVRLGLDELVLMTREEAARHEKEVLKGEAKVGDLYGEEVTVKVKGAMEECRAWEQFR